MLKKNLRVIWFVPPAVAIAADWDAPDNFHLDAARTLSSDEQFDALVNGTADAAVTSMDNVFHWNLRPGPQDFVIVAQVESTTPLSLMGWAAGGAEMLEGMTVLVDAPENGFVIALRALLDDAGLAQESFTLLPVGGVRERFEALIKGQGHATLLGPPFDALARAQGLHEMANIQAIYPSFPGQGVVVRKALADHGGLKEWLRLLVKAARDLPDHLGQLQRTLLNQSMPAGAVQAMIQTCPTTLVPSVQGIDLLISHRNQLNLPGADVTYEQLVDMAFLSDCGGV
ncbi:conserved exported protein of unknown function [Pseudomonas sp. JV551A1]|uniref:ABC transporter substrate-binding protein n=1 Tax=Pseudomonas inefficax TaxID=2078786 RepID=A0AAQ1PB79_9PSED|nr:ABC transporter substrate-binding protein [Pseudomonas]SPO54651.1 conserved exported protein of unknown function [Pseudomonas sp. JV551A1]SPO62071.1 conserved exported protein of unknown function [Pseudomonas inefficax]